MNPAYPLVRLAELVGGTLRGDGGLLIRGVADVAEAGPTEITWATGEKYADALQDSRAGAVLVSPDFGLTRMPAILCERVDRSVAKLLGAFAQPVSQPEPGIHPTAVVHASARIAAGAALGPHSFVDQGVRVGARSVLHAGVFVGRETTIGEDCVIWPNAVIRDRCTVGHRVIIHPNAVIGADGLGFYFDEGRHNKIPHIGGVVIGDDVEIGACTCIDRSKFGNTIVGRGTKIDNLVQIAHNVRIGDHCVLTALSGIAGSSRAGDFCVFGARSTVLDHVALGKGVRLAALTVVTKDVAEGQTVSGIPAQEHRAEMRERASMRRLPVVLEQLRELRERVERLEASIHHHS